MEEMSDYACGGGNPCMNGGECRKALQRSPDEAKGGNKKDEDEGEGDDSKRLFVCKCLPAFRGELCEYDYDPCSVGDGVKTCQPFKCIRVPEDPYNGFK